MTVGSLGANGGAGVRAATGLAAGAPLSIVGHVGGRTSGWQHPAGAYRILGAGTGSGPGKKTSARRSHGRTRLRHRATAGRTRGALAWHARSDSVGGSQAVVPIRDVVAPTRCLWIVWAKNRARTAVTEEITAGHFFAEVGGRAVAVASARRTMMHVVAAVVLIGRWARGDRNEPDRARASSPTGVGGT